MVSSDNFLSARNGIMSVILDMERNLSEYKRSQDERNDKSKMTEAQVKFAQKTVNERQAMINELRRSLEALEIVNSNQTKRIEYLELENLDLIQVTTDSRAEQERKECKSKRAEAKQTLSESENRTLQLLLNPQLQVELYGHLRIVPQDYERYITDVYQHKYPVLHTSFQPYYQQAIQQMIVPKSLF